MPKVSPDQAITLYCMPCAGASSASYLRWRRRLPHWVEVRPIEMPGHGSKLNEPLCREIGTLLNALEREFADIPSRYALFGHSMGGLVAFELAHRLSARGQRPLALFAAGCPAPSERDRAAYASIRTDDDLMRKLLELDGTPPAVFEHPDLLRLTLDILGADFQVCGTYEPAPRPRLDVPIHVLSGRDEVIAPQALTAWQRETSAEFSLTHFVGGHFFVQNQEGAVIDHLLRTLTDRLPQSSSGRQRTPVH